MNGESTTAVDEPPAFCNFHDFCEYCAVANVRDPSTPRHEAHSSQLGVEGVVNVLGSMRHGQRRLHQVGARCR